ncbi:cytochrome P450 [Trametes coccinea BRFM310]|uniref:Cytochrome P450 n=1 Tax=Trametes coccinea (strain BRFM310) TaxID=1353009 RepID=A0A1Y2IBJ8_TRAC3|nr:cytochrome P450 [Trametes coccinea BRFM310]
MPIPHPAAKLATLSSSLSLMSVADSFLLLPLALAVLSAALWQLWSFCSHLLHNRLRALPGPPSPSRIFGYAWHFWTTDPTELHEEWVSRYGRTLQYRILSYRCLFTMDTKALGHILVKDDVYQKPRQVRSFVAQMLGNGTVLSEGEQHRRQKRVVNPAFGSLQIRGFTDLFLSKASQLRDILSLEVTRHRGVAQVDLYEWVHRMTLDVIGEAAFSYNIGTLSIDRKPNELCDAFRMVSQSVTRMSLYPMLRFFFPILRILPEEQSRRFAKARKVMAQFARQLIEEKRRELAEDGGFDSKRGRHKQGDFLTLVVEANMGATVPPSQQLSDKTIIDECTTFLPAGHETTAITLAWFMYNLARYPAVQEKLRKELFSIGTDMPTIEQLSALRYLDNVLREVVRLHPSLPSSLRMSMEDDMLPLGEPVYINGVAHDRIWVPKGTPIVIPILAINRDKALWGEDAFEFRPDRWDALPEAVSNIPGIWAHNLTFMGGQHACLGFRFSLNQIKVAVFTLLRAFEFELAVPVEDIGKSSTLLVRPMRVSQPDAGPQLPMLVRAYRPD